MANPGKRPRGLPWIKIPGTFARRRNLTWAEKAILSALLIHSSQPGGERVSTTLLAEELGLPKRSVIRILVRLEEGGELMIERSKGRRSRYGIPAEPGDRMSPLGEAETGDETSPVREDAGGDKTSPDRCQKDTTTGVKTSPAIKRRRGHLDRLRRAPARKSSARRIRKDLADLFDRAAFPKSADERGGLVSEIRKVLPPRPRGAWYEVEFAFRSYMVDALRKDNPAAWLVSVISNGRHRPSEGAQAVAKAEMSGVSAEAAKTIAQVLRELK